MEAATLPNIIFETNRLRVRCYDLRDKENFFALNGNDAVMQYIRATKTREESDLFLLDVIAWAQSHPGLGRWAVIEKASGAFVGSFAIIPIPEEEEKLQIGYALVPGQWGKGFATELTNEGLNYFFEKTKDPVVYGVTEAPNTGSQNVLLKAGFQLTGKKMEGDKELFIFSYIRENR